MKTWDYSGYISHYCPNDWLYSYILFLELRCDELTTSKVSVYVTVPHYEGDMLVLGKVCATVIKGVWLCYAIASCRGLQANQNPYCQQRNISYVVTCLSLKKTTN